MNITESDKFHLRAAVGWLELGNHIEADAELDNISPEWRASPAVLGIRWHIFERAKKWDACLEIAKAVMQSAPDLTSSWIHLGYSARRATGGSVQAAYDALLPAADKFHDEPLIPYNLGCYSCQLGKLIEAREWIAKAFSVGNSNQLKLRALEESDLEPLWSHIARI